jgi:DNA-binding NarL/FixJ family response regulator
MVAALLCRDGRYHHLTQFPDEEGLFQFLKVGVNAYQTRMISPEVLREIVRRVSSGAFLFSDEKGVRPNIATSEYPHVGNESGTDYLPQQTSITKRLYAKYILLLCCMKYVVMREAYHKK